MSESINKSLATKKSGLGRGLGSLLSTDGDHGAFAKVGSTPEPALKEGFIEKEKSIPESPRMPEGLRIWNLAIENLEPNPKQPRTIFTKEALLELSESIKEKGIIQPLLVRKKASGKFEIIAGERRWRAAQLAGLKEVPALIKDSQDQEVLEIALIENIQRENLNPVEEAEAYEHLMTKYNMTQQELAVKVGKDRSTIANLVRLLVLHPEVRKMMIAGEISLGHAKVLLSVADPQSQRDLALRTKKESLSVRALEKLTTAPSSAPIQVNPNANLKNKLVQNVQEEMQKMLGSKVGIDYSDGKGKIMIHFYSDDELNQVVSKLRASWQK